MNSRNIKSDIKRIKYASINDKLVIFVGTGVSMNSGLPSWEQLIGALKAELPESVSNSRQQDNLKIAQLFRNSRGYKEYIEKIREELKKGSIKFNPIHESIFELSPSHVVTTNYDNLLEQAVQHKNLPYYTISKDGDIPYASDNKLVIKMHGDLDIGNIVLTEDDYLNYSTNFPLIETYVKSLFTSKLVLFVGFSFDDYNLKIITNSVKNLLGDDFQPMYLLNTGTTDDLNRDYYTKRGVRIVECSEIETLFNQEQESIRKVEKLSDPLGQKLFTALEYIKQYDSFEEDHRESNIVDTLYDLTQYYFDELHIVGGKELLNFYPFNKCENKDYQDFRLGAELEEIVSIRKKLRGNFIEKRLFLKTFGYKYRQIQLFAILNGIHFYEPFTNQNKDRGFKISVWLAKKYVNGIDHIFELDFNKLYKRIEVLYSLSNQNVSYHDLELPYLLYFIGRYKDAYLLYKQLSIQYWQQKKYILYFICQNNIKNIAILLWQDESKSGHSDFDAILKDANEINLEDILLRIQTKSEYLYNLVRKIYDYTLIFRQIYKIDELKNKIDSCRKSALRGGSSMNNYVYELNEVTYSLWNFTNNNFILSEHYSEHISLYMKAFEGFILSNQTPEIEGDFVTHNTKLNELHHFHILFIVYITNISYLERFFKEHNISTIAVEAKSIKFLFESIHNAVSYLNSNSTKDGNQATNKLISALNNLIFILSKTNADKSYFEGLLKEIMVGKFALKTIDDSLVYFIINEQVNQFSQKYFTKLLEQCLSAKNIMEMPKKSIRALRFLLHKNEIPFKIVNETVRNRILQTDISHWKQDQEILLDLYHFLEEPDQEIIVQKFNSLLLKHFEAGVFSHLYDSKIPIEGIFSETYLSYMEQHIKSKSNRSRDYGWINTLYVINQETENIHLKQRIEVLSQESPFLTFLLNPDIFKDAEQIEISWFKYLSSVQKESLKGNAIVKKWIIDELKQNSTNKWLLNFYFVIFDSK